MYYLIKKLILFLICVLFFAAQFTALNAKVIKKITIKGNDRISNESILLFSGFKINETITNDKLDEILKNLYDTNFFKNFC